MRNLSARQTEMTGNNVLRIPICSGIYGQQQRRSSQERANRPSIASGSDFVVVLVRRHDFLGRKFIACAEG